MISCIIVDDEPIARKGLADYVSKIPFLKLEGNFQDAISALEFLNGSEIQLMILDINMPEVSGIQLLKSLLKKPLTVIVSAHSEYAVESFNFDVIDYIVKPVPFDRFLKAMNKVREYLDLLNNTAQSDDHFFVKSNNKIERITTSEILFIESLHNYVKIHTIQNKYLTLLSLKAIEEYLPAGKFLKVHKSYIVNTGRITSIEGDEMNIGIHKVPVSRSLREEVLKKLIGKNFLRR